MKITINFIKKNSEIFLSIINSDKTVEIPLKNFINLFKNKVKFTNKIFSYVKNDVQQETNKQLNIYKTTYIFALYEIEYNFNTFFFEFLNQNNINKIELIESSVVRNVSINFSNPNIIKNLELILETEKIENLKINDNTFEGIENNKNYYINFKIDTVKKFIVNAGYSNFLLETFFRQSKIYNIFIEKFKTFDYKIIKKNYEKFSYQNNIYYIARNLILKNIKNLKIDELIRTFEKIEIENCIISNKKLEIINKNISLLFLKNIELNYLEIITEKPVFKTIFNNNKIKTIKMETLLKDSEYNIEYLFLEHFNSTNNIILNKTIKQVFIKYIEKKDLENNLDFFKFNNLIETVNIEVLINGVQDLNKIFNIYEYLYKYKKMFNNKKILLIIDLEKQSSIDSKQFYLIYKALRKGLIRFDKFNGSKLKNNLLKFYLEMLQYNNIKDLILNNIPSFIEKNIYKYLKTTSYKLNNL